MTGEGRRLLDPAVLARLSGLKLRVRAAAEGVLSGLHRSPHHGQSVEFSEHKEYAPGDELRHVDWKVYGKSDKYYVKRFEQETNLRAWLVVDASGSMGYRGDEARLTKLGYACTMAGTLAHLLVRQQDAAGLAVFSGQVTGALTPRAEPSQVNALLETLEALEAGGETRLESAVRFLAERARRRSAVMILSDLLDRDEGVLRLVADLRRRRHEVTLFHLLDPAELDFPFDDATLFLSMEDDRSVEARGRDVRKGYLELVGAWLEKVRRACGESDVEYVRVRTDQPLDEVLVPFLARRERSAA
ncbi:MAG TPA: DUF58 domain-containing protein [Anaeromyxobacteraceae bacterium]|nr:DUF58 domain-containing protein [Anaeromyxobacteraceae bacterium]